ncbi:MAG: hypothetical protein ABSB68_01695 [Acidimicrobiales bacterium]
MAGRPRSLERITVAFLVLAAVCCVAQFALSFFAHVAVRPPPGGVGPPAKTYFEAFGLSEVVLTALGLAAVALVGFLLSRRRLRDEHGAGFGAWAVSAAAAALGVLGFPYLFGVAICLLLACSSATRSRSTASRTEPTAAVGATHRLKG